MLGIKAIANFVPTTGIDNYAQAVSFGKDRDFVERRIGVSFLPRRPPDQETSDLGGCAVNALLDATPNLEKESIGALVVVTQNPDGNGLPHTSAILHRKLGLNPSCAAFDISLGCSGYVYGLYALTGFMQLVGIEMGVLVTADPYSKILAGSDAATDMLFGDAATATLISSEPLWALGASKFGTDGNGSGFLENDNGLLRMNGRRIFEFAKNSVPGEIDAVLKAEGLSRSDIDQFLVHQGSLAVVDSIRTQFGPLAERFTWSATLTGNTVSSSIPLLLQQVTADATARRIIVSGFGVGLSIGTAVLNRLD
jgi:3-oxoacyl-[acyl-carrier-protein] synthase-3